MSGPPGIELREYEPTPHDLSVEDATHLAEQSKITVARPIDGAGYILNANQFVGVLTLPSGRRVEAWPKVPVHSIVKMLSVVHRFEFKTERADFSRLDAVLEAIARVFADGVERRMRRGLYRAYVEREGNLTAIRGRIMFAEDVRHNYILRHRMFCRFSEFTWDIPENQVIRQVAHTLAKWDFATDIRRRLARIDADLSDITPSEHRPRSIDNFRYHRLNEDYKPIHDLCRLILEAASLSERAGASPFPTFLVDMNKLFEEFVSEILTVRAQWPVNVRCQHHDHLAHGRVVSIVPDILVRLASRTSLVADCKYKRIEPEEFKNFDVYQVLAYCTAMDVDNGLLIYPRRQGEVAGEIHVRNSNVVIRTCTINLDLEPAELDRECDRFAMEVFALATAEATGQAA